MRDHNKTFCRLVAETFRCPGPVYEFGSYQVEGQEGFADLRGLFPGDTFVGCDMRAGPGVDRIEDISDLDLPDESVGTALCIETFEHVFELRRAFDEVHRVLKPGGLLVITSPLNFRIHGYPDDYWRMTPSCLRRLLAPYGARLVGSQGHPSFPHTVMALAVKGPASERLRNAADGLARSYQAEVGLAESDQPWGRKVRRALSRLYRSKGERQQLASYSRADFVLDTTPVSTPSPTLHAKVG